MPPKARRDILDDELLICAVQSWPCLWDKNDECHYVRSQTTKAWNNVSKEVGVEVGECKTRWIRLRDYFVRITRQKKIAEEEGVPFQRKKWNLYELLMFLYPMCSKNDDKRGIIKKNIGNDEILDNEGEEMFYESESGELSPSQSFCSDDLNTTTASKTTYKSAHNKRKRKAFDDLPAAHSSMEEEDDLVDNPNQLFFRSLLPAMNKLDDIEVMEFRMDVQSLLLKYLKSAKHREGRQQESAASSSLVTSGYFEENENQDTELDIKALPESGSGNPS